MLALPNEGENRERWAAWLEAKGDCDLLVERRGNLSYLEQRTTENTEKMTFIAEPVSYTDDDVWLPEDCVVVIVFRNRDLVEQGAGERFYERLIPTQTASGGVAAAERRAQKKQRIREARSADVGSTEKSEADANAAVAEALDAAAVG